MISPTPSPPGTAVAGAATYKAIGELGEEEQREDSVQAKASQNRGEGDRR